MAGSERNDKEIDESWKDMPWIARIFIRNSNIWKAYLDHDRQEKLLRQSQMDWTIVSPVMLDDKEDEAYFATTGKPHRTNISRKALARFILDTPIFIFHCSLLI